MQLIAFLLGVAWVSAASCGDVQVYRTSSSQPFHEVSALVQATGTVPVLDLARTYPSHPYFGLGVSFVEAGCKLLAEARPETRAKALRLLFSPTEGAGLSMGRLNVGCSDYSSHFYTYADVSDDFLLKHFSIDPDRPAVLPVVKEAMRVNPELFLFASPWTPPAWMKLGRRLCGGWIDPKCLDVYGDYLVRYLKAYRDEGVMIRAFTMQNEPFSDQGGDSPDCIWGANEEIEFAARVLPKKLRAAGLGDVGLWLCDAEPKMWRQVAWELEIPEIRAITTGIAWHSYGSEPEDMIPLRRKYPDIPMYHTEMGPNVDHERRPLLWWGEKVLRYLNAGCGAFTSWCIALDEQGLPSTSRGFNCAGLVEIDSETREIRTSRQWELFRQIGPFVKRGAAILETGFKASGLQALSAFRNPDGTFVVIAVTEKDGLDLALRCEHSITVRLPADTVTTIVWRAR